MAKSTKSRVPWLKLQKKSDPELPERPPIWLGSRSNGEYFHDQTPAERKVHELVMKRADEQARYLGMDRREFLASSMGMFTTLAVINQVGGCGGSTGDGTTAMSPDAIQGMMGGGGGVAAPGAAGAGSGAVGTTAGAPGVAGTTPVGGSPGAG